MNKQESSSPRKTPIPLIATGAVVAVALLLFAFSFIVHQGEVAVVTTFGNPQRAIEEPGFYLRWPWPIHNVYRFDNRLRTLPGALEETQTNDGKIVIMRMHAGWQIDEPITFLERVGSVERAEGYLDGLIRNYKNDIIGRHSLSALLSTDPEDILLDEMEREVQEQVQREALERYSIKVAFVGTRQLSLPENITESVFERMRAERERLAEHHRSMGESDGRRIRAEADSQREQILAVASAEAEALRAEGDAQAIEFYRVFERDPELAQYLRKLSLLETTMTNRTTLVVGTGFAPFDLLRSEETPAPNPEEAPAPQ
jgi:modulator of FtsH protease HflC